MVAAKFNSEEANGLRRAMATFRNVGTIGSFEDLMVNRMIARGYDPAFAEWVTTAEGRQARLGTMLRCVLCTGGDR